MPGPAGDDLGHRHGFVLGLVRQHRAFADIADGPDARHIGAVMVACDDTAALVQRHARFFQAQARRKGNAADGDQHDVRFDHAALAARRWLDRHLEAGLGFLHAHHLGGKLEGKALLGKDALEGLADFAVHARGDAVEEFHHRHFAAQPPPH